MEIRTKLKYTGLILIIICIIVINFEIKISKWVETPLYILSFVSFIWFQLLILKWIGRKIRGDEINEFSSKLDDNCKEVQKKK